MRPRTTALLALLLTLGSCVGAARPSGTLLATEPPGARVVVDGRDSGFSTPCMIDLDDGDNHWIRFEREGYESSEVVLVGDSRMTVVSWRDATIWGTLWAFPLFFGVHDLLVPFRIEPGPQPGRVHVRLRRGA